MALQHPSLHPRRGFNLIEAAIVLAVVGAIVGGIWVAAASVMENNRQTKLISILGQMIEKTQRTLTVAQLQSMPTQQLVIFYDGCTSSATTVCVHSDSWSAFMPADLTPTTGAVSGIPAGP